MDFAEQLAKDVGTKAACAALAVPRAAIYRRRARFSIAFAARSSSSRSWRCARRWIACWRPAARCHPRDRAEGATHGQGPAGRLRGRVVGRVAQAPGGHRCPRRRVDARLPVARFLHRSQPPEDPAEGRAFRGARRDRRARQRHGLALIPQRHLSHAGSVRCADGHHDQDRSTPGCETDHEHLRRDRGASRRSQGTAGSGRRTVTTGVTKRGAARRHSTSPCVTRRDWD